MHPPQEVLRRLVVLRVGRQHMRVVGVHGELAGRALGQSRVQDVGLQLRILLGDVLVGIAQRLDVDRGAVERRGNGLREERAVVVGVVPGKAALVMRVLPETGHELDRLDGLLAVDDHLAVRFDFLAAPGPHVGVGERRRVAEGVTERLADRTALRFQLLGDLAVLLPGVRERGCARLFEPRFPVGDHGADDRPRHR